MALPEKSRPGQNRKYEQPRWNEFEEIRDGQVPEGKRVARIIGRVLFAEPCQEGVLRYPPVQVIVPRDPDFITEYIDMGPTDWRKHIHPDA
jgi:hypothetical protein